LSQGSPTPLSSAELAAFVAAVEAASVHGAADALNLTQSAVTKRLQALERRTGVVLFERGRNGLRTTAAGRLLYPEAKEALATLARAEDVLRDHRESTRHLLRIAASHTIGECLLPGWLATFRRHEPQTRAQVEIVNSHGVLRSLADGEAEVGFIEGIEEPEGLQSLVVHHDTIVVVVGCGHRWAGSTVTPDELLREPYVAREAGSGTRAVGEAALLERGIRLTASMELASLQSVKRVVAAGDGFSLLSPLAIDAELRAGVLREVPLAGAPLTRELRAVRPVQPRTRGAEREFWRWLEAWVSPGRLIG
jgi:DNA-binding transcriptional LysR family regulator